MSGTDVPLDLLDTAIHAALPVQVILQQWRRVSPVLRGPGVTLREPRASDARDLLKALAGDEVARFVDPPAASVSEFEQFIEAAQDRRAAGQSVTFAVVPDGASTPFGLFHVCALEPGFGVAEWQFALHGTCWGDGLFFAAAPVLLDFVFGVLGTRRIEARAAVRNGRGNGALRKLGAVQEALLRESFGRVGEALDQVLWAILADEWRARRPIVWPNVH